MRGLAQGHGEGQSQVLWRQSCFLPLDDLKLHLLGVLPLCSHSSPDCAVLFISIHLTLIGHCWGICMCPGPAEVC